MSAVRKPDAGCFAGKGPGKGPGKAGDVRSRPAAASRPSPARPNGRSRESRAQRHRRRSDPLSGGSGKPRRIDRAGQRSGRRERPGQRARRCWSHFTPASPPRCLPTLSWLDRAPRKCRILPETSARPGGSDNARARHRQPIAAADPQGSAAGRPPGNGPRRRHSPKPRREAPADRPAAPRSLTRHRQSAPDSTAGQCRPRPPPTATAEAGTRPTLLQPDRNRPPGRHAAAPIANCRAGSRNHTVTSHSAQRLDPALRRLESHRLRKYPVAAGTAVGRHDRQPSGPRRRRRDRGHRITGAWHRER